MPTKQGGYCLAGGVLIAALVVGLALSPVHSQSTPNEREVKSESSPLDKSEVYALDFRFKDPRFIKVNIPGRGTRIYWYLWYQVINRTGKPQRFSPVFELVTQDYPAVRLDEIEPTVEEAIRKEVDLSGYHKIKNSVQITGPIPPSKPVDEAFPIAITGMALWDGSAANPAKRDPKVKDLSDTASFSIFVNGLSNGFVEVDSPLKDGTTVTHHKTLQLNFRRKGDRNSIDSRDIEFVPPAKWIYRGAGRTIPAVKTPEKKDAPEKLEK